MNKKWYKGNSNIDAWKKFVNGYKVKIRPSKLRYFIQLYNTKCKVTHDKEPLYGNSLQQFIVRKLKSVSYPWSILWDKQIVHFSP